MKLWITTLLFVMLSSAAFALPTPKDIETAVNAGQMAKAEGMLREVIREKPDSAKAHYELGQVLAREGRRLEARDELLSAQRIDPALKFARDPKHFQDLLDKLPASGQSGPTLVSPPAPSSQGLSTQAPMSAPQTQSARMPVEQSTPWMMYLLVGGGLLVFIVFVARRFGNRASPAMATAGGYRAAGAYPAPGMPGAAAPGAYGAPNYGQAPPSSGMGVGGAVLGGVAGLAAGYGLARAFGSHDDAPRSHGSDSSGYTPLDSGYQPQQDFGSFDSGTGDSWDSGGGDSGGGSDDSSW